MTISMHPSLTAIGRQLHADYLPTLAKPLSSELKGLVVRRERSIEVLQSAVAKPGPHSQSTRVSIGSWCRLKKWIFDPYRPELHYMRGPGPKWREKHAQFNGPLSSRTCLAKYRRCNRPPVTGG